MASSLSRELSCILTLNVLGMWSTVLKLKDSPTTYSVCLKRQSPLNVLASLTDDWRFAGLTELLQFEALMVDENAQFNLHRQRAYFGEDTNIPLGEMS